MSSKVLRMGSLALSALALATGLGSCGKVAEDDTVFDSNTNWLRRCRQDDQCGGSLRCYCGICTKPCAQNSECGLLSGAQCAESGESLCGEQASAGGLCVLACTEDLECGAGFKCGAGQCVPKPCEAPTTPRTWDDVFQEINADLARADRDTRLNLRYLELGNGPDSGESGSDCGPDLDVARQAMSKLLNSLSTDPSLQLAVPIDAQQRLYRIDLRDYGWNRLVIVDGAHNDAWEAIVANDPYALSFVGDDATDASADTGTLVPVLPFDSFVAAATQPRVYYGVLGIAEQLQRYLVNVGIATSSPLFEAGFVDQRAFLAKYVPMGEQAGFLWDIADFGRDWGELLASPLAEPLGQHELVFTLPNGLNAFAFMDANGLRLDRWSFTADSEEADGVSRPPRSSWRRHPREVRLRDQVREYIDSHLENYRDQDIEQLRQRFPGSAELSALVQRDFENFAGAALARLAIDADAPDPVLQSYADFQAPVTLGVAAAELMMGAEELRDNLELFNPLLRVLDGGTVRRDLFTALYSETLCTLTVVLENQIDSSKCP